MMYQLTCANVGGLFVGVAIGVGSCEQALPIALTLISSTLMSRDGIVNPNSL